MKSTGLTLAFIVAAFGSGSALADGRAPNTEEHAAIEKTLKAAGFTTWSKVELDDSGYWDVDDAVNADGKRYDVDLDAKTFEVVKKEVDND